MECPDCGSTNISSLGYVERKKSGYSFSYACCGYFLLGWPGLFCGLYNPRGSDNETITETYVCNDCSCKFS
jgi:hypothetical protein